MTDEEQPSVPDYSGEEVPPSEDKMTQLRGLVAQMMKHKLDVMDLEEKLEEAQAKLKGYEEGLVPSLMQELGLVELKLKNGGKITAEEVIRASFPKDPGKRERAFSYLEEEGEIGMVKNKFTVEFGRDSQDDQRRLRQGLTAMGFEFAQDEWIEPQTLLKFLREQVKAERPITLEDFGAFKELKAKFTLPKK